jgi:hypothetical protein
MTIRAFFYSLFKVDLVYSVAQKIRLLVSLVGTRRFDLSDYGQTVKDNPNL